MKEIKSLIIESTPKTPLIDLNNLTGDLIFSGKSIPENAAKVYEPVFNWVTDYILRPRPTTNLRLNLDYFNTATSLWLTKIIKVLISISEPDYTLIIHLYLPLEDFEEMKDFDDIKEIFMPFLHIPSATVSSIGIKFYCTDDNGEVIKNAFLFL